MGTVMKIILYIHIYFILIYVKESEESSKSYISKHDLVLEFLLPLNFTRGNALAHKREERDIDGSGDGDLDKDRRPSFYPSSDFTSFFPRSYESHHGHEENKDAFDVVINGKLLRRSKSKENLEDNYEGSGEPNIENESLKTILTPEEDPFTKDLEPEIVKKLLGVESSTKSLDDDNSQDNTLNVLPNVKDSIERVEEGDEGSGDEEDMKEITEKVEEMPENEIIDEEEEKKTEEDRVNSYILEKPLGETTTESVEPATEVEEIVEATTEAVQIVELTSVEEIIVQPITEEVETVESTTEEEEIVQPVTEEEETVESTTEFEEEIETTTADVEVITEMVDIGTTEIKEKTTEESITTPTTISSYTIEVESDLATTEEYVEDSTTITPDETATESFLNLTDDYSILNATEILPENASTLAIDPLLMAMDTKYADPDGKVSMASNRLGAYIVIGLILLSFLSLIGYIALRKRITKRRKELENNQETKDTEKALLSLTDYKDHLDPEENNIKNNEITPIVIQNSQRNKFEKNTNFSSPKNLNTNTNEKTIEKDNVLKSTSDNLTHVIIEDSGKEIDEEKENIPNTEKLIVRTHLDQDSIPKRAIIVNRTSGGYLPVSQDNNM